MLRIELVAPGVVTRIKLRQLGFDRYGSGTFRDHVLVEFHTGESRGRGEGRHLENTEDDP